MSDKFTLNESGEPVPCDDLFKWGEWMQSANRHVGDTWLGDIRISTVFLGLNHEYRPDLPPLLWETMVFGGSMDQEQERCSGNREQAEAMHARMVAKLTSSPAAPRER